MTSKTFIIAASGGDYTSISGYVTGEAEDLIAGGHTHTVIMNTDDLDDASAFVGFTADAANFVKFIVAGARKHDGKAGAGNRVINNTGDVTFRPVSTLDGLILDGLGCQAAVSNVNRANACDGFTLLNCFFETTGTAGSNDVVSFSGGTVALHLMRNCFLLGGNDSFLGGDAFEIQFCTAYGAANRGYVNGKMRNCIGMGAVGNDFDSERAGTNYNLDSDGTADGANSVHNETDTDIFVSVTGGSEDLNLKNGTNNANGAGIRISGVTTDYAGNTRADPPDIGAHEFVVVVGAMIIVPQDAFSETDNIPNINTGVTVALPQDSLIQTDNTPDIQTNVVVQAPQDIFSQTDNVPGINTGVAVNSPQDDLSQTDNIPDLNTGVTIAVPVDSLGITDNTPIVATGVKVSLPQDSLSLTHNDPVISTGVKVSLPADVLTIVDNAPLIIINTKVNVGVDNFTIMDNIPVITAVPATLPIPLDLQNWNTEYAAVLEQFQDQPELQQFAFDLIETINELRAGIDVLEARIVAVEP